MKRTYDEIVAYFIEQLRQMRISNDDKMLLVTIVSLMQTRYHEDAKT